MPQPWAREGTCRVVCVPVRARPRPFKPRDVARIAQYANEAGFGYTEIVAHVVDVAGQGPAVCFAAAFLVPFAQALTEIQRLLRPTTALRILAVLRFLLRILPARFRQIVVIVIAVVRAVLDLLEAHSGENELKLLDASQWLGNVCAEVRVIQEGRNG